RRGQRGGAPARRDHGPPRPVALDRAGGRRAAGRVEPEQAAPAPVMDQPEIVAAEAVHVGVDDGDRGGGGDGGVERIAAVAEYLETGVRGERVRRSDETAMCVYLASTVRVDHAPIITYERARSERRNHSAGARRCFTAPMTSRAISSARSASGRANAWAGCRRQAGRVASRDVELIEGRRPGSQVRELRVELCALGSQ